MNIKKLARMIANEIFEWQLEAGNIKSSKMLKMIDGRTGFELTPAGEDYMTQLTDKWVVKILPIATEGHKPPPHD